MKIGTKKLSMNKFLLLLLAFIFCPFTLAETLQDDFATEYLKDVKPAYTHTKYDYTDTDVVPIKICVAKNIKSEAELYEGQDIEFRVLRHAAYKNKIIARRGDIVNAKVKIIITSGMNGIPASIIFDNFRINEVDSNQLTEMYEIFGQDRTLIVFPLKWLLTILPPSGSLTNLIKGGHAKLKTSKTITIYYHPNWI